MDRLADLATRARDLFKKNFGEPPSLLVQAPGRVNLIGEHTDYNDGFVFPVAIDRRIVVAVSPAPDASKVWSEGYDAPAVFDVASERRVEGWGKFPSGCAWILGRHGHSLTNINAQVVTDLPTGSGVSSSAAIELAFLTAWNVLDGLGLEPMTLALHGQQCEHEFVGVHCGIMDQAASALGRAGHAMLLDTRSLEVEYHPIPEGIEIVLCDTNKRRSLDVSAYNDRRRECQEAASALKVPTLREATVEQIQGTFPEGGEVKPKRARHVVTENERCALFAKALADGNKAELGRLMKASHLSLRDDYEVSCPELDWMAESAWEATGCVGARMTGAGFGGACVALVASKSLDTFLNDAKRGFMDRSNGLEPTFLACQATDGAGTL